MYTTKKPLCILLCALLLLTAAGGERFPGGSPLQAKAASANELAVYNYCSKTLGLNNAACCGIMGNIEAESNFSPSATGDEGQAYGICQWYVGRFTSLTNWCRNNGLDYTTIEAQLQYMRYELEGPYSHVLTYLRNVENSAAGAYNAGYYFAERFEIPANNPRWPGSLYTYRANLAQTKYWPIYGGITDVSPVITAPAAGATLNISAPGNLTWNAVSSAASYRYTVERVNTAGAVLATLCRSVLVSSQVTSVSLDRSQNTSLSTVLQPGQRYKATVLCYSDASGAAPMGAGTSVTFSTATVTLETPVLTSHAISRSLYSGYFAGAYTETVPIQDDLVLTWTATGSYYLVSVRVLTGAPSFTTVSERGDDLFTDQRFNGTSLTLTAAQLNQHPGEYIRVKLTAVSNAAGTNSSLPVYYYFRRSQNLTGYTLHFDANGGIVEKPTQFVMELSGVTLPRATAPNAWLVYTSEDGRFVPESKAFSPVNIGWATDRSSNTVTFSLGRSYEFAGDMDLYAVWKTTLTLSTQIPLYEGYTFRCWAYQNDGTTLYLNPGDTLVTNDVADVMVKAVWDRDYSQPRVKTVSLRTIPEKIIYNVGEKLDTTGLTVLATYEDKTTAIISEGLRCTPVTLHTTGITTVAVYFGKRVMTYIVYVFNDATNRSFRRGDVDFDGKITSSDARLVMRAAVKLDTGNYLFDSFADVDGDGVISSSDARLILRGSIGLEDISRWMILNVKMP